MKLFGFPEYINQYKKGDVIIFEGYQYIVMAVLSGGKFETTYNICTTELMGPKFGVKLTEDSLVPFTSLSDDIKKRVKCFI